MVLSISDIREILFGSATASDTNEETDADGTFVPSELDLSVRVGHGGNEDELARELHRMQRHADEIERRD